MTTATLKRKRDSVALLEHTMGGSPQVDRESGVISNVKVLGRVSKNGRQYSDQAMHDACRLLEGITVNIDHDRKNPERGFLSGIGILEGLEVKPDGVYAKRFVIKKSHPSASLIFESAENFPKNFGLSINANGRQNDRTGVVESIINAQSVDIVGKPATTNGLFESHDPKPKARKVKITIKSLVEALDSKISGAAAIKSRLAKIMEDSGGDSALMGAPVPMTTGDGVDGGEPDPDADPMDALNDAFAALVASVMQNDGLALADKISQITAILTTQDTLLNGDAAPAPKGKKTPVQEDEGGDDMSESVKESLASLTKLVQTSVDGQTKLLESQKRTDAKILLMESSIAVTPEKIDALVNAKDGAAQTALIESWPPTKKVTSLKPAVSAPLMESIEEPGKFIEDSKALVGSWR